jgi:hypothetical protein
MLRRNPTFRPSADGMPPAAPGTAATGTPGTAAGFGGAGLAAAFSAAAGPPTGCSGCAAEHDSAWDAAAAGPRGAVAPARASGLGAAPSRLGSCAGDAARPPPALQGTGAAPGLQQARPVPAYGSLAALARAALESDSEPEADDPGSESRGSLASVGAPLPPRPVWLEAAARDGSVVGGSPRTQLSAAGTAPLSSLSVSQVRSVVLAPSPLPGAFESHRGAHGGAEAARLAS